MSSVNGVSSRAAQESKPAPKPVEPKRRETEEGRGAAAAREAAPLPKPEATEPHKGENIDQSV
jgi:hypothetical protein